MEKYKPLQHDNENLKAMAHQLTEMDHDYDVMLRERIESKKQLEAKFQDIARKIQANKEFTNAEVKRVKDTLKAFQSKFNHKLKLLKEEYEQKIKDMIEFNRTEFSKANERMNKLDESIRQEISDRITETDDAVNPVRSYNHSKCFLKARSAAAVRRRSPDPH